MIPVGYLYKRVAVKPDGLKAAAVHDIYSLSNCISGDFTDYIDYWKHNGYWLFNSPAVMEQIAVNESIALLGTTLFYYEAYEYEFDEDLQQWSTYTPETSFETNVQVPIDKHLEGFDVTTFYAHSSPEHSPLSCNALAAEIPVNEHCLFNTLKEAKEALERGLFKNSEHGPYRIFAVYTVKKT
ncbi:MAG: hypothetical protein ACU837_12925 [Gammaproteobacteria bacterium]